MAGGRLCQFAGAWLELLRAVEQLNAMLSTSQQRGESAANNVSNKLWRKQ